MKDKTYNSILLEGSLNATYNIQKYTRYMTAIIALTIPICYQ